MNIRYFSVEFTTIEQALIEASVKAKFDIEEVKWLAEMTETDNQVFRPIPSNTELTELEHYRQLFHAATMIDYLDSVA